jgi:transposase
MRGRSQQIGWREEDTDEAIKAAYRAEPDGMVRTRLHGLWLWRASWSLRGVAELLGNHYRSVQRWVGWYRQGGLATGQFHTAVEIRDWIAEQYHTSYTVGGVYSLLKRLQCNPKVPRPINPKADRKQQESWIRGDFAMPSLRPARR